MTIAFARNNKKNTHSQMSTLLPFHTPPLPCPPPHTHMHTHVSQSGLLVVWKVDSHGQLHPVPLHQHRMHAPLTHCEMLHPVSTEISATTKGGSVLEAFTWERKSAALMAMSVQDPIACFCASVDGMIMYIMAVTDIIL